ncbi:alpha/beta hydrolase family protein [Aurantiacibacter rhizosphaerae]|uniref:Alpha/beta hydrolase n=1 Tax=Aurantiacibacter rhizosphaerae TaxID=2691582 RepID=A0A844XCF1_9SPHN|nr:hypothetical protein [Aurantiacibacter rhizosphaerae]MWV28191.1 hypothetical protein [Aurantiacibacter rhizosphaerae]
MRAIFIAATCLALCSGHAASAQQEITIQEARTIASEARDAATAMIPDLPGTGPYPATYEILPDFPDHVIFRPADMDGLGDEKLPLIVWGNGGCQDDVGKYRLALLEVASHGYVIVAPGGIYSGPRADISNRRTQEEDGVAPGKTSASQIAEGIDWGIAASRDEGSAYFNRLDTDAIGVSGRSCGGGQAIRVAADPRVKAAVFHNTGIIIEGEFVIDGKVMQKSELDALHTPVLYIMGGPSDVAYPNGTDDFYRIDHVPVMLVDVDTGHLGTYRDLFGGRNTQMELDWLDWQLKGDQTAARTFVGPACRLCLQPDLRVMKKGID